MKHKSDIREVAYGFIFLIQFCSFYNLLLLNSLSLTKFMLPSGSLGEEQINHHKCTLPAKCELCLGHGGRWGGGGGGGLKTNNLHSVFKRSTYPHLLSNDLQSS